jgi:hypothetical protein
MVTIIYPNKDNPIYCAKKDKVKVKFILAMGVKHDSSNNIQTTPQQHHQTKK